MSTGHHEASWRLPESDPHRARRRSPTTSDLARIAERGTLRLAVPRRRPACCGATSASGPAGTLEPLTLLTALAAATEHIGLIATASTTYNEPYNLARRFASLDHISGGRAGWNIVTTAGAEAARNFGLDDEPAHAERYERAAEFLDVAAQALGQLGGRRDRRRQGGRRLGRRPTKSTRLDHRGTYFRVEGALNVPRSPQGYPLLVQAGSSEDGKDFAARYAEAVFTAQQTLDDAQAFYADLKARTGGAGRDPDGIKILPGIVPVIGAHRGRGARARGASSRTASCPSTARRQLAHDCCSVRPGDARAGRGSCPPTCRREDDIEGAKSRYTLIVELARREQPHRAAADRPARRRPRPPHLRRHARAGRRRHRGLVRRGAPPTASTSCPPVLPSGLELFVDHVVPILRARGLFRTEYARAQTLREHYGLPRPANQYVTRRAAPAVATDHPHGTDDRLPPCPRGNADDRHR